jgi:hypothetical protein
MRGFFHFHSVVASAAALRRESITGLNGDDVRDRGTAPECLPSSTIH